MKHFIQLSFAMILCIGLLGACNTGTSSKPQTSKKTKSLINRDKAIDIAEQFVMKQGYTKHKTNISLEEALFEEEEYATSIENLMKIRQNMLMDKAYSARLFNQKSQWAVAFEFVEPSEEDQCRFVVMDTLGNNVYMSPMHTFLLWFDEGQ